MTFFETYRYEAVMVGVLLLFVTGLAQSWDVPSTFARLLGLAAGIACCTAGTEAMLRLDR